MSRRPPTSTLFPYPTPCQSGHGLAVAGRAALGLPRAHALLQQHGLSDERHAGAADEHQVRRAPEGHVLAEEPRSEEHTSELQSRQYLVCRLLLEKKNTL